MTRFFSPIIGIIEDIQPVTYILVAAVLVVGGIYLIVGGEKGRQKVKEHAVGVIVGVVLVLGAIIMAEYLTSQWNF